jgi:hypothetical protein
VVALAAAPLVIEACGGHEDGASDLTRPAPRTSALGPRKLARPKVGGPPPSVEEDAGAGKVDPEVDAGEDD